MKLKTIFLCLSLLLVLLLLSACTSKEEKAVQTAQGVAIAWQNEDYSSLYDYFIPELQAERSKEDFITFVISSQEESSFNLVYDKVVAQDNKLAYAYYTFSGVLATQLKSPAIKMEYVGGEWKFNGFSGYFIDDCITEGCYDYAYDLVTDMCEDMSSFRGSQTYDCWSDFDEYLRLMSKDIICDKTTNFKCEVIFEDSNT